MDAFLLPTVFGMVLLSSDEKVISTKLFIKKASEISEKYERLERGEELSEIRTVLAKASERGVTKLIVEDETIAHLARGIIDVPVEVQTPSVGGNYLRSHLLHIGKLSNAGLSEGDLKQLRREIALHLVRSRIQRTSERRDILIIQAVGALDEVNKTINLFASRLREWYGIHFPEMNRLLPDHEAAAQLVVSFPGKETITSDALGATLKISVARAEKIVEVAQRSIGASMTEIDMKQIQLIAQRIIDLSNHREMLQKYIENTVQEVAPNLATLIGPVIAARLLSIAGGLEKLARMPSSTIQVLGAEKALFRSKMTGSRPPKHGILFQHSLVHSAKRWQRGKISRVLAGKLSIAARIDAYSEHAEAKSLEADVQKRIAEIKEKYPEAPVRPQRPVRSESRPQESRFQRRSSPPRGPARYKDRRDSYRKNRRNYGRRP